LDKVVKCELGKWITYWQSQYGANNQKRFTILTLDNELFNGERTIERLCLILVKQINSLGDGFWTFAYIPERQIFLNNTWWSFYLAKPLNIKINGAIDRELKRIYLDALWARLGEDFFDNIVSIYLCCDSLFVGLKKNYYHNIRFAEGCAYAGKRQR